MVDRDGEALPMVRGRLLSTGKQAAMYPGELPSDPARLLSPARKGADRFSHTHHHDSVHGVPLLEGCSAIFECRNLRQHEEGDHLLFIGEVERCTHHADRAPLLYHSGHMHTRGLI